MYVQVKVKNATITDTVSIQVTSKSAKTNLQKHISFGTIFFWHLSHVFLSSLFSCCPSKSTDSKFKDSLIYKKIFYCIFYQIQTPNCQPRPPSTMVDNGDLICGTGVPRGPWAPPPQALYK